MNTEDTRCGCNVADPVLSRGNAQKRKGKKTMSTIKDLKRWYEYAAHCVTGYCCEQNIPGKSKYDLVKLGYNAGVYGWNWTAYLDSDTNTLYVSYYRNVPAYIRDK